MPVHSAQGLTGVNVGRRQVKNKDSTGKFVCFMVDRNIVNKLGLSKENLDQQVSEMFGEEDNEFLEKVLKKKWIRVCPALSSKGQSYPR